MAFDNNDDFEGQAPYEIEWKKFNHQLNKASYGGHRGIVASNNEEAIAKAHRWTEHLNNLPGAKKHGLKSILTNVYSMFRDNYMEEPFQIWPKEADFGKDYYTQGHPEYEKVNGRFEKKPKVYEGTVQ